MPLKQGTHFSRDIFLTDANGDAVPITGWTFRSHIRDTVYEDLLLELTTGNGGLPIVDAAAGHFRFIITAEQSDDLPTGKMVFDVHRTDIVPGPVWLFDGGFRVKKSVTRDE